VGTDWPHPSIAANPRLFDFPGQFLQSRAATHRHADLEAGKSSA